MNHGIVRNISEKWKHVKCDNYIICTDGVHYPDKQTIEKLCKWNPKAVFYRSNGSWRKIQMVYDYLILGQFIDQLSIIHGTKYVVY